MALNNIRRAYIAVFLRNLQFFGAVSIPFFIDWLRVDYTRAFVLQAWFLFWMFVLEIPTGIVADKFGRKISVALGCLLLAADMLLFGLVRSYGTLFLAEFLGAVGMTLISGAEQALLYDSILERKEAGIARYYFSRYEAAGTAGLLVAFPVGSSIAGGSGYPALLPVTFLMTAAAVVFAGVAFFSMREPPRKKPIGGFVALGVNGLKTLFAQRDLRAFVLNAVTISAVTFFAFWFYQPATRRAGLPVAYLGYVAAGFNLFSAILLANVPALERRFGIRRLLFYSALIPGVLFLALGFVSHLAFVIPSFVLAVGCKMVRVPILNDLINRYVESENRATVISSVSLLERFITFLLYPITGMLADVSLDGALILLGAVCLVLAVATRISDAQLGRSPTAAAV